LNTTVEPIGDYSTYTLNINNKNIDPIFNEIKFKFRPGCFNINCAPDWQIASKPEIEPEIDYLAKDFDSFKHTLVNAMAKRIPGWLPTSEADLDVVLLELFSAVADELSDYQDRVMNEAYIDTARKRVSLARHARLMDYFIYQGNQSQTFVAIEIDGPDEEFKLKVGKKDGFKFYTEGNVNVQEFITKEDDEDDKEEDDGKDHFHSLFKSVNNIDLYTWDDTIPSLAAGDTTADLYFENSIDAQNFIYHINEGEVRYLLIEEKINPETGKESESDPNHRQLLKLLGNGNGAKKIIDPLNNSKNIVRVFWEDQDKLQFNYCFTIKCNSQRIEKVSLFYGNILPIFQGHLVKNVFVDKKQPLLDKNYVPFERTNRGNVNCELSFSPLLYKNTSVGGSNVSTESTLQVFVKGKTNEKKDKME